MLSIFKLHSCSCFLRAHRRRWGGLNRQNWL